jgi:hypothetical protein
MKIIKNQLVLVIARFFKTRTGWLLSKNKPAHTLSLKLPAGGL